MSVEKDVARSLPRATDLFQPDAVFPIQFWMGVRRGVSSSSEKRLMLAVLEDAIECFQKYCFSRESHGKKIFGKAAEWIHSSDKGWPYSYENICETLDLDPGYLRRGLEGWRRNPLGPPLNTDEGG